MIISVCILWQLLLKQSGSWNLVSPPVGGEIKLQWIITCLDYYYMEPCMDKVWPMTTKDVVHIGLRSQMKTSFADGIKRLANRYTICFEKRGDYTDK
jgi:hypothetical protein